MKLGSRQSLFVVEVRRFGLRLCRMFGLQMCRSFLRLLACQFQRWVCLKELDIVLGFEQPDDLDE